MSLAAPMFRWLDLLEKEFDKAFVELDVLLGDIDEDQSEITFAGRQKLTCLSSSFAQLAHKSQTIFQSNAKFEAELISLRTSVTESQAKVTVMEKELKNTLLQLHAVQLQLHSSSNTDNSDIDSEVILNRLENELTNFRRDAMKETALKAQVDQYQKENDELRREVLQLQGEVSGARLAAKYLDKELAGRIQQIQLLGRNLKAKDHDILWNQIESEIHLHRHKTVIRACRGRQLNVKKDLPVPPKEEITENDDSKTVSRKKRGIGETRLVELHREKHEGLGISITGGVEHGVPIIVSEIHEDMPAERCSQLYVGDAILSVNNHDLKNSTHKEAVHVLSRVHGDVKMEVVYIDVDESDGENDNWEEDSNQRYSSVGLVDDPSLLTDNEKQEIIMTNTPGLAKNLNKKSPYTYVLPESSRLNEKEATPQENGNSHSHQSMSPSPSKGKYPGILQRVNLS